MNKRPNRQLRGLALWAMCVPLLLLSLIPPGVMLARADNGVLMLTICSGDGMIEMAVDPITLEPVEQAPDRTREACPWALAHGPVDLGSRPDMPQLSLGFAMLVVPLAETDLAIAQETGLPPATGPPTVV